MLSSLKYLTSNLDIPILSEYGCKSEDRFCRDAGQNPVDYNLIPFFYTHTDGTDAIFNHYILFVCLGCKCILLKDTTRRSE